MCCSHPTSGPHLKFCAVVWLRCPWKAQKLVGRRVGWLVSRYSDTFQCKLRIIVDVRMEFCGCTNGQVEIEDEHRDFHLCNTCFNLSFFSSFVPFLVYKAFYVFFALFFPPTVTVYDPACTIQWNSSLPLAVVEPKIDLGWDWTSWHEFWFVGCGCYCSNR